MTRRLLAIQGQDQRGARLAIRARSAGLTAADVDHALTEERSLLITWLNRGTLHLVHRDDYPWLHALTAPQLLSANARRLAQEGVTPARAERGVATIERALMDEGQLTRAQLGERIAAAGVRTEGQALVHLLMLASLRGIAIRGPMAGSEHAYVLVRDWLGEAPRVDRAWALAELARRYLAGHGPADDRDLARWAGVRLRDARAGLDAVSSEVVEHDGALELAANRARRTPALPPPKLLGAYDPVLLGWVSREAILAGHKQLVTVNGLFRPFALVEGRAAAIWRLRRGEVELEPLRPLSASERHALTRETRDAVRFLRTG